MATAHPALRMRNRGSHAGLLEIVFSENQSWDEAQEFATSFMAEHGMTLLHRCDGPDAWLWDVSWGRNAFVFGYDDYPCETVLFSTNLQHQDALLRLFQEVGGDRNDPIQHE